MAVQTVHEILTQLIARTDPDLPPTDIPSSDTLTGERELIAAVCADATPDQATLAQLLGVYDGFLTAHPHLQRLTDAAPAALAAFASAPPEPHRQHLRKNSLMSCYLALRTIGRCTDDVALVGVQPAPLPTTKGKTAQRAATNDEVLLTRLAVPFGDAREPQRIGAAVAIACTGASTAEGPQVLWRHHQHDGQTPSLTLVGRHPNDDSNGWHVVERTLPLSRWNAHAFEHWRTFATGYRAQPDPDSSVLYTGNQPLTSQSAKNSYDAAIKVARTAADLHTVRGLSAGSYGLWAAAHAGLTGGADAAAAVHGVDPANTLRQLTKATDRAYKLG